MVMKMLGKNKEVERVLKAFKKSNPWAGTVGERIDKFNLLFKELKKIYDMKDWQLICSVPTQIKFWKSSRKSCVYKPEKVIILSGKLSVITFLHEFGHAIVTEKFVKMPREKEEKMVQEWAVKLFSKVFPEKFEKLKSKDNGALYIVDKKKSKLTQSRLSEGSDSPNQGINSELIEELRRFIIKKRGDKNDKGN